MRCFGSRSPTVTCREMTLSKFWAWALGLVLVVSVGMNLNENVGPGPTYGGLQTTIARQEAELAQLRTNMMGAVHSTQADANLRYDKLFKYVEQLCSRLDLAAGMPRYSTYNDCVNKAGS